MLGLTKPRIGIEYTLKKISYLALVYNEFPFQVSPLSNRKFSQYPGMSAQYPEASAPYPGALAVLVNYINQFLIY
jgi:hypothetical protein